MGVGEQGGQAENGERTNPSQGRDQKAGKRKESGQCRQEQGQAGPVSWVGGRWMGRTSYKQLCGYQVGAPVGKTERINADRMSVETVLKIWLERLAAGVEVQSTWRDGFNQD